MWAHEVERWLPWLTPGDLRVVRSSLDAPEPPPAPPPKLLITSFQMLERLRELDADGPFAWRSVVVDEAHVLGASTARPEVDGGAAARSRKALALVRKATGLALLLSGTPSLGRPLSLFPLLDALACGGDAQRDDLTTWPRWLPERDEKDRRVAFCRAFCGARKARGGRFRGAAVYDGVDFHAELHAVLAGLWMVRRLKKDVLAQLPPLRRVVARLEDLRETKKRRRGGDDGADAGDDDDDDEL
mmetsp:Transcript_33705/g.103426  ORF Transcript_33705/g.103426 Transcript_33705/m.103426 type:complete len:244 (-) Transcript_33705:9-740(-)